MSELKQANRQRLRPWLIGQINSGRIPGLYWLNNERTKFRIPWKNAGKKDWNPSYSQIFVEWAKQTGSYREGVDKPDYVTWKTRLRCALHKAKDIEYLEHESQVNEDYPEPFRVYELKPQARNKRKSDSSKCLANINNCTQSEAECHYSMKREAPVPTMVIQMNDEISGRIPTDLSSLDSTELRQFNSSLPIDIESCLQSLSGVTMMSHDNKVATATSGISFDVQQLTESMNSITFDQVPQQSNNASAITASAQKSVLTPAKDYLTGPISVSTGHHNLGQIVTHFADRGDAALSQTPLTQASPLCASFPQPSVTFQPLLDGTSSLDVPMTTEGLTPNGDDHFEQFGCLDLQDMLDGDDF